MTRSESIAYLQQLAARLTDLKAEEKHAHLCVGDLRLWTEVRKGEDVVCLRGGWSNARQLQRTFRKIGVEYIEAQVRRVIAEHAQQEATRKEGAARMRATIEREDVVVAPLREAAELVNEASRAARHGQLVSSVEVNEAKTETGYRYLVDFHVENISPAKALAIITLIGADRPWLCDELRCQLKAGHAGPHDPLRCESTCSDLRCELEAGHGRFHKYGTAGWDDGPARFGTPEWDKEQR